MHTKLQHYESKRRSSQEYSVPRYEYLNNESLLSFDIDRPTAILIVSSLELGMRHIEPIEA